MVKDRAAYLALGMTVDGAKQALGQLTEQAQGAGSCLRIMTEPKNRGVNDILIAAVEGLKGFPEAMSSISPRPMSRLASCTWRGAP